MIYNYNVRRKSNLESFHEKKKKARWLPRFFLGKICRFIFDTKKIFKIYKLFDIRFKKMLKLNIYIVELRHCKFKKGLFFNGRNGINNE